jgi:DNA-binding NtrC family response regulator/ligand-binding sensor domain-containing protein
MSFCPFRLWRASLVCVFALISTVTSPASADGVDFPGFVHRTWTVEHGLPQNMVGGLLAARDGYLWVGGNNGIIRFDGLTFTAFDVTNTPALKANRISAFHESADGTIWIGTARGIVRYRGGVFTRDEGEGPLADEVIVAITEGPDGRLLAASLAHVYRRDANGRWTTLPLEQTRDGVTAMTVDRHGSLWIASEQRLIEWRDRELRTFTPRDGLPDAPIRDLREDRDGRLWIGTERGLAHVDPATGLIVREHGPLAQLRAVRLFVDADNVLWIGGLAQLAMRAPDGQAALHEIAPGADEAPVVALAQDTAGQIWYGVGGGAGGLHRLSRHRVTPYTREQGLPCDNIAPVTQGTDGTIWFGALCSERSALVALKDGQVRTYGGSPSDPMYVSALLPLPDGELLIGRFGGDVLRFKDGRIQPFAVPFGASRTDVHALYQDDQGALWVGTREGLARHQDGQWRTWRASDGLASSDVHTIIGGRDHSLWIGTGMGVTQIAQGRLISYGHAEGVPPGEVRALYLDADDALWIGTYGGGLARWKDGRATAYGTAGGLLDLSVHRIIEDDRGDLWLSGDRGVRRVNRRELVAIAEGNGARPRVEIFDTADGMKNAELNGMGQPAGLRARDGSLWFPSQGGLVRIDPAVGHAESPAPPVAIESVLVNGVAQPPASVITVPPGSQDLEIRFTAPALARPEQIYFRYRLLGHDDEAWVDAGRRRLAHFGGLGPGDYRFEVAARSSAGAWNAAAPASLRFVLQPRFYQRPVFKVTLAGLLLLAPSLGIWLRLRQLRYRARALEATVAARTVELRADRDGLRQALSDLSVAKTELEGTHTRLLTTFNQLRVGVILVDAESRVRFLSDATRKLVGERWPDSIGQPIERVLPIGSEALDAIRAQIHEPQAGMRITMELAPASGERYWAELDVQRDPGEPGRRILYLYDVTETYDLKRALQAEARPAIAASLLGESVVMRALRDEIATVAGPDATVVIEGETGTGKELVARAIHEASRRATRPFVAINCAGLTESILASQLFGHRRGAFTGAVTDHVGLFEAAHGGTLLLDEIGDMPAGVQTHLLRVLQEREILRLGDSKPRPIDVRLLAATHRDLDAEVAGGRFREDLLYRIRVIRVRMPPLRARRDDVPLLAATFLRQARAAHGLRVESISREAMEQLQAYRWPGNVRELKQTIEGAAVRASGAVLKVSDVLPALSSEAVPPARRGTQPRGHRLLLDALRQTGGNRKAAARLLGMARSTLYRRLALLEAEGVTLPPDRS